MIGNKAERRGKLKILVTGANGYLGRGIVKALLDVGTGVTATDYMTEGIDRRAERYKADLFSIEEPYMYFGKPDVLLHLAWRNGFVHNDESHIADLYKHYGFLDKMISSGIERVAVMGSMHEVGFFEGSIKAETPCEPQSLYGISKNALRQSVSLLCKKNEVKFQWIRGFYIVGSSKNGNSIFSKIVQAEERGDETFPFTNGQNQWDFIDYDDFCKQVSAIVTQDRRTGIINACSGYPEKLADRVEKFIFDNHFQIRLAYGTFPDRPYDSKAVWGDDSVIREILSKE